LEVYDIAPSAEAKSFDFGMPFLRLREVGLRQEELRQEGLEEAAVSLYIHPHVTTEAFLT
jgi:hypothetical protein